MEQGAVTASYGADPGKVVEVLVEGPSKNAPDRPESEFGPIQMTGRTACDRIVVFDHGAIVQEGSHRELLDEGGDGLYGRLWHHQSGGFLVE